MTTTEQERSENTEAYKIWMDARKGRTDGGYDRKSELKPS